MFFKPPSGGHAVKFREYFLIADNLHYGLIKPMPDAPCLPAIMRYEHTTLPRGDGDTIGVCWVNKNIIDGDVVGRDKVDLVK